MMTNEEHLAKIRAIGRKFIPDEEFNALLDQLKEAECRKYDGETNEQINKDLTNSSRATRKCKRWKN